MQTRLHISSFYAKRNYEDWKRTGVTIPWQAISYFMWKTVKFFKSASVSFTITTSKETTRTYLDMYFRYRRSYPYAWLVMIQRTGEVINMQSDNYFCVFSPLKRGLALSHMMKINFISGGLSRSKIIIGGLLYMSQCVDGRISQRTLVIRVHIYIPSSRSTFPLLA